MYLRLLSGSKGLLLPATCMNQNQFQRISDIQHNRRQELCLLIKAGYMLPRQRLSVRCSSKLSGHLRQGMFRG
jgi:hypothetical protein